MERSQENLGGQIITCARKNSTDAILQAKQGHRRTRGWQRSRRWCPLTHTKNEYVKIIILPVINRWGLYQVFYYKGGALLNKISALIKKGSIFIVRTQDTVRSLQSATRKRDLLGTQPCWNPYLRLPSLWDMLQQLKLTEDGYKCPTAWWAVSL